jgi:hypothetical protein
MRFTLWLKHKCRVGGGAKSFQKTEQQGGLAHAGLPYEYLKPETKIDTVDQ